MTRNIVSDTWQDVRGDMSESIALDLDARGCVMGFARDAAKSASEFANAMTN